MNKLKALLVGGALVTGSLLTPAVANAAPAPAGAQVSQAAYGYPYYICRKGYSSFGAYMSQMSLTMARYYGWDCRR